MEIVFFFLLSNLKSTLSSLRQCLGLPPKCLLEVRLYWKQFTHYLVHIAILKVTTAKDVPLIMAQLWLWEFFLLSPWTWLASRIQFFGWAWHYSNTSDMRTGQTYIRLVQWSLSHIYFWGVLTGNKNTEPTMLTPASGSRLMSIDKIWFFIYQKALEATM